MSFTIVGTRFARLYRFEKEGLYLQLLGAAAAIPPEVRASGLHAWLVERVAQGRCLREIAEAIEIGTDSSRADEAWSMLDDYVGWLIEMGYARAVRLVVID